MDPDHLRHHRSHAHLNGAFGGGWFGQKAEAFARFFGTPKFLLGQTVFVLTWIVLNALHVLHFDLYPFILLNLCFSLQSAYAAPLILLASTRQADRDKAHEEADAKHREELASQASRREEQLLTVTNQNTELLTQNTDLTQKISELTTQIDKLTRDLHKQMCADE